MSGRQRSDWTMRKNKNIILGIVWNTISIVHGVQKGELPLVQTGYRRYLHGRMNKWRRFKMTKVDIVSGFLGAGKTTLIKKLIAEAFQGEKLVLIENEFGEIGIDGGFLKDAGIEITEMNSGCICCSLVGDFGEALKKVLTQYAPDRIIIEPSGVGKLSDVIKAVQGVAQETELELDSFVTVADATKAKMYMKNFGEFFNNQIESASTIILSRTQKMAQDKLEAIVALLRSIMRRLQLSQQPGMRLTVLLSVRL